MDQGQRLGVAAEKSVSILEKIIKRGEKE